MTAEYFKVGNVSSLCVCLCETSGMLRSDTAGKRQIVTKGASV